MKWLGHVIREESLTWTEVEDGVEERRAAEEDQFGF